MQVGVRVHCEKIKLMQILAYVVKVDFGGCYKVRTCNGQWPDNQHFLLAGKYGHRLGA